MRSKLAMTAAIGALILLAASPADAQRRYHGGGWRGGGWGWGAGAGFAAGALLGGALATRPYYEGYAYEPGYAPGPAYGPGDAVAYCARRFRSYDPASGTYLGRDGLRHSCP